MRKKAFIPGNYRAIISDFDGTLAGSDAIINKQVIAAVAAWQEHGYGFSIATGRQYEGVIEQACRQLHLTSPLIVRGGAQIVDAVSGKALHTVYMRDSEVKALVGLLRERQMRMWVEKGDTVYTHDGKPVPHYGPVPFGDVATLSLTDIPKVHIRPTTDVDDHVFVEETLVNRFPHMHFVQVRTLSGKSWDITAADATKQLAVVRLAQLLDIEPEHIIGIGDGYNDYPLLSACGYRVVMGNAVEELKPIADILAPSVSDDGVAKVIQAFLRSQDL